MSSVIECKNCGHAEYAHYFFVGECIHGQMVPKDGQDCNCQKMTYGHQEKSSVD